MQEEIEKRQLAILKKRRFLDGLLAGEQTLQGLNDIRINKKRNWMEKYGAGLLEKYRDLPPEEQAYRVIYFDHMGLCPEDVPMTRVSDTKIRIESRNFCPYLEACLDLSLDTRIICRDTGEDSFQVMAEMVNPGLKFSRNYVHIRPNVDYCEEYIEFLK